MFKSKTLGVCVTSGLFISSFILCNFLKPSSAWASKIYTNCYALDESSYDNLDHSNLVLCLTSDDLKKYPHSIVTVTVEQITSMGPDVRSRNPASISHLYEGIKTKFLAKRHYVQLAPNEFGRKGSGCRCGVVFNEHDKTVFLGFLSDGGKTFFYKPFKPLLKSVEAQR